jgi:hypothetical protein
MHIRNIKAIVENVKLCLVVEVKANRNNIKAL